jgi:signal transduction protein with GAF and PtsI domain
LFVTNGTQTVVLPNATNCTPGRIVSIISAMTTGSVVVTNANGVQTVMGGASISVPATNHATLITDGSNWW